MKLEMWRIPDKTKWQTLGVRQQWNTWVAAQLREELVKAASIPGWNQMEHIWSLRIGLNICTGSGAIVGADVAGSQRTYSVMEKPAGSLEAHKYSSTGLLFHKAFALPQVW